MYTYYPKQVGPLLSALVQNFHLFFLLNQRLVGSGFDGKVKDAKSIPLRQGD